MSTDQPLLETAPPKAEFKDTPASVQYAEFGVVVVGGFLAWWCYTMEGDDMRYLWAAGGVVAIMFLALIAVHKTYGNKTSLKHLHNAIVFADRGHERTIPFNQLRGFSAAWTDIYTNCVYAITNVRFSFDVEGAFRAYLYDSSARQGTLKYQKLQALQADMSQAVSQRMRETLLAESSVPWTLQLTITTSGIEYRKRGTAEPQLIPFSRLANWEVKEGVFKLTLDDDRRPSITEDMGQRNFFPGLILFAELHQQFGRESAQHCMDLVHLATEPSESDLFAAGSKA